MDARQHKVCADFNKLSVLEVDRQAHGVACFCSQHGLAGDHIPIILRTHYIHGICYTLRRIRTFDASGSKKIPGTENHIQYLSK